MHRLPQKHIRCVRYIINIGQYLKSTKKHYLQTTNLKLFLKQEGKSQLLHGCMLLSSAI